MSLGVGPAIERVVEIDSTNSELLRRAAQLPDRWLLSAQRQTQGRGRRGRVWHSGGESLCLSLFARLPYRSDGYAGLSIAIGIATAEALRAAGATGVQVKWPNDLHCQGRKLGGILIEVARLGGQACELVVGLGLNIALPHGLDVGQPRIDLAELGLSPSREVWEQPLATVLSDTVDRYVQAGLAPFLPRWSALDALAGRYVRVEDGPHAGGRVLGLAEDGALRLSDEQGEWRCRAGEVSVRADDVAV